MAPRFTFRPLTMSDLSLLFEWRNRPHVAEWWGGPVTLEQVHDELGAELRSDVVQPFLAFLDDVPAGFIQVYDVMKTQPEWWPDETDPGARGIDQFLADPAQLGRGLGAQMVAQFVAQLFGDPAVTKVQADPAPENARAIRTYEKAGFQPMGRVETPDGPALLMVARRAAFEAIVRQEKCRGDGVSW